MQDIFLNEKGVSPEDLATIAMRSWYRHGVYRNSILFISAYIGGLGRDGFANEWIDDGMEDLILLDDQAYITTKEHDRLRDAMYDRLKWQGQAYLSDYIEQYKRDNQAYLALTQRLGSISHASDTSHQLAERFSELIQWTNDHAHWLWSMEFLNPALGRYLHEQLQRIFPDWSSTQIDEFITTISYFPEPLPFQTELNEIIEHRNTLTRGDTDTLNQLFARYAWRNINTWDGRPWSFEEYQARIKALAADAGTAVTVAERRARIEQATQTIASVEDPAVRELLETVQAIIYLKTYRVDVFSMGWANVLPLIDQIVHQLNISYEQLLRCTSDEILAALEMNQPLGRSERIALVRLNHSMHHYGESGYRTLVELLDPIDRPSSTVLTGQSAYPGIVRGIARVVLTDRELHIVQPGEILVANLTNPNYNCVFSTIRGMVTDEGGILCHSAIMAREFRLPTVIGTKTATKNIQDGDLIELDGDRGMVTILALADSTIHPADLALG